MRQAIQYGRNLREPGPETQTRLLRQARDELARTHFLNPGNYGALYGSGLHDELFELVDQSSFAFMFDSEQRSPSGNRNDGTIFAVMYNSRLMRDVRFVRICAKLGLCDYWLKTDRWPDCAAAVAPSYDFKAEARRLANPQLPNGT